MRLSSPQYDSLYEIKAPSTKLFRRNGILNLSEYGKTVDGLKNNTQFSQNLTPLAPFFTPLAILVLTPSSDNFEKLTINYYNLSLVKTDATLSANNSQYCLMFTLPLFAHPVACGCVLLGVVEQSLKQVKLLAAFKQTQQIPTLLGQQCWELLSPFVRIFIFKERQQLFSHII